MSCCNGCIVNILLFFASCFKRNDMLFYYSSSAFFLSFNQKSIKLRSSWFTFVWGVAVLFCCCSGQEGGCGHDYCCRLLAANTRHDDGITPPLDEDDDDDEHDRVFFNFQRIENSSGNKLVDFSLLLFSPLVFFENVFPFSAFKFMERKVN